jgi:hypothetical protein
MRFVVSSSKIHRPGDEKERLEGEGLESSATCSCIVKLRESVTLSRIFPQIEIFHGFSFSIIDRGTAELRCGGRTATRFACY